MALAAESVRAPALNLNEVKGNIGMHRPASSHRSPATSRSWPLSTPVQDD